MVKADSDPQGALIRALLDQRCYPHPVETPHLVETHISWVILTGSYAYKIKKPVRLDFLDFSSLERRHHFCEEELRLNRRFAPELYLDVVPITGTVEHPRMAGPGPAIEYALRLKQFPPDSELSALLDHGSVPAEQIAELGQRVARIHVAAPQASIVDGFRHADTAHQSITRNTAELLAQPAAKPLVPVIQGIRHWMDAEFVRRRALLASRAQTGSVRECHGDLHSSNVVRLQGTLRPFDCIEFDSSLSTIDIQSDIGFLVMDLEAHGRHDLAYAALNAWLEETGDYDGLPLQRYFRTYRALVRAKVTALRAQASGADSIAAKLSSYAKLARRYTEARQPSLILTCGLSASGKTWLSSRLMTALPAIRVRSDVERKRLAGLSALASSRSADQEIYTAEFNERTYQRLLAAATTALDAGEHVIVDAAFLKHSERRQFLEAAQRRNVPATIVHCDAPRAVLEQRILDRQRAGNDASEATTDVLALQYGYWEPFDSAELPCVLRVDTSGYVDADQIPATLRSRSRPPDEPVST